jgi:hypothetical protein
MNLVTALLLTCPLLAAAGVPAGFPFADEALVYSIVWPSGLSLGEGRLSADRSVNGWAFNLSIDAAVPGYSVKDTYHAVSSLNLCSAEFSRDTMHGIKKASEKTTISNGLAVRQTVGGGKSELPVSDCAHDALTYLFFARRELGQGKVPPSETILFGAGYQLQLQYTGAQNITVGSIPTQADRVFCTVTVKQNQHYEFEIFFARDAARTPLLIRAPFALGAITMELVR